MYNRCQGRSFVGRDQLNPSVPELFIVCRQNRYSIFGNARHEQIPINACISGHEKAVIILAISSKMFHDPIVPELFYSLLTK